MQPSESETRRGHHPSKDSACEAGCEAVKGAGQGAGVGAWRDGRTSASGFTRNTLPRQVVAESRADRIAADTSPYGSYDDEMLPAFAGCGEGMGAAVWACGLVVLGIIALAVVGAVVGGGR